MKEPSRFLIFSLGLFFCILGFQGIVPDIEESVFTLNTSYSLLEIVFGIVELLCGIFLIADFFTKLDFRVKNNTTLVIIIFWALRILLSKFVWGLGLNTRNISFHPNLPGWLLILACELVILASLWSIHNKRK